MTIIQTPILLPMLKKLLTDCFKCLKISDLIFVFKKKVLDTELGMGKVKALNSWGLMTSIY